MKENRQLLSLLLFFGFASGLVVGVGALMVGGGSFWGHWGGVCTGEGFQRSYADLTP